MYFLLSTSIMTINICAFINVCVVEEILSSNSSVFFGKSGSLGLLTVKSRAMVNVGMAQIVVRHLPPQQKPPSPQANRQQDSK